MESFRTDLGANNSCHWTPGWSPLSLKRAKTRGLEQDLADLEIVGSCKILGCWGLLERNQGHDLRAGECMSAKHARKSESAL